MSSKNKFNNTDDHSEFMQVQKYDLYQLILISNTNKMILRKEIKSNIKSILRLFLEINYIINKYKILIYSRNIYDDFVLYIIIIYINDKNYLINK